MARMFTDFPELSIPFEVEHRLAINRQAYADWKVLVRYGHRLYEGNVISLTKLREWLRGQDETERDYKQYIKLYILPHIRGSAPIFRQRERVLFEEALRRSNGTGLLGYYTARE